MSVFLAYLGFWILSLVVAHLALRARWRRRSIQDLLKRDAATCRERLDLEKALRQAYEESGIPRMLLATADFLTLLCVPGVVLAWVYLPNWYLALAVTVLLPLAFTILYYHVLEFAGPWWGFPSDHIRSRFDGEVSHDWDGCECRECGAPRNGGHRWNSSCRCDICGRVRHRWNATECVRCGAKRPAPPFREAYLEEGDAAPAPVQVPLS